MATFASHSAWSDACSQGGDGQCDGIIPDEEKLPHGITDECMCLCHSLWPGSLFESAVTVEDMRLAHVAFHKEFPSTQENAPWQRH